MEWGRKGANLAGFRGDCDNPYLCHYYGGVRAYDIAADPGRYILHAGYFDMNELLDVNPPTGSIFIKAATEPFSDEMKIDEDKLHHWLEHFGILSRDEKITRHHISGHASGPDLLQFIKDMNPARVIPIHTEHTETFESALQGIDVIPPQLGRPIDIA